MRLTENQEKTVLEYFSHNLVDGVSLVSALRIGQTLIEKGKCLVAGDECIWRGGIGNFVICNKAEDAVGVLEYTFDLGTFLSSVWFRENTQHAIDGLNGKLKVMTLELNELVELRGLQNVD